MKGIISVIVIIAIGIARAQLNFEGDPLTEYTEYTAEESEFLSKATETDDGTTYLSRQPSKSPQKLYPVHVPSKDVAGKEPKFQEDEPLRRRTKNDGDDDDDDDDDENLGRSASIDATSARVHVDNTYGQVQQPRVLEAVTNTMKTPAELALSTFLNSKTPEESRVSLDYFLQNSQPQSTSKASSLAIAGAAQQQNNQQLQRQSLGMATQAADQLPSRSNINQSQQQQRVPVTPVQQRVLAQSPQVLQISGQPYARYVPNSQPSQQTSQSVQSSPVLPNQAALHQSPFPPDSLEGIQLRNDMTSPVMWRPRNRWIRGKPYPLAATSRIGGVFPQGPFPRKAPVELIYAKPPGYYRGPSHGPVYEDASAWFPDASGPPPATNDIYYSQLYAQSYDPHYYNYIAKTGKIKPHLYGKLGKYPEHEGGGIWSELYRGFTKHGLKNIMTPGFLLGMTLPMITVMLMALVQKRSFGRSDSRSLQEEDDSLREYAERLQRALECYERKRRKPTADDC